MMTPSRATRALIGWEPVSERIMTASFRTTHRRIPLTIIMCYAPTNDAAEETKEEFYEMLQHTVEKRGEKEIILIMGDLNAKVGDDNTGYERAMGRHKRHTEGIPAEHVRAER